jgi:hypothetical protein
MIRAPSGISATAASREESIFDFIRRSVQIRIDVLLRLFTTGEDCATPWEATEWSDNQTVRKIKRGHLVRALFDLE